MQVYSTKDYDCLFLDTRNRPIDRQRVERLKASISSNNALHLFPIIVNAAHQIVDGQHRYTAARELGVEIHYIVGDVRPEDIAGFAYHTKGWGPRDYLNYWAAMGNDNYIRLSKIMDEFSRVDGKAFLTVPIATGLCSYMNNLDRHKIFASGEWVCNDEAWGRSTIRKILDFRSYVPFWNNSIFIGAVANLCANCHYDHDRMMNKMQWLSTKLVKCPDQPSYIRLFNEIYNYRQPESTRVELRPLNPNDKSYRIDRKGAGKL